MLTPKDLTQKFIIVCEADSEPKAMFTCRPFSVAERNAFSDKLRALPVDAHDQRSIADIHTYYREIVAASLVSVENVQLKAPFSTSQLRNYSTTFPGESTLDELSEVSFPVAGYTSFLIWLGAEIWKRNNPVVEKKTSGSPA